MARVVGHPQPEPRPLLPTSPVPRHKHTFDDANVPSLKRAKTNESIESRTFSVSVNSGYGLPGLGPSHELPRDYTNTPPIEDRSSSASSYLVAAQKAFLPSCDLPSLPRSSHQRSKPPNLNMSPVLDSPTSPILDSELEPSRLCSRTSSKDPRSLHSPGSESLTHIHNEPTTAKFEELWFPADKMYPARNSITSYVTVDHYLARQISNATGKQTWSRVVDFEPEVPWSSIVSQDTCALDSKVHSASDWWEDSIEEDEHPSDCLECALEDARTGEGAYSEKDDASHAWASDIDPIFEEEYDSRDDGSYSVDTNSDVETV